MSDDEEAPLPATIEINTSWFLSKLPQLSHEDRHEYNAVLIRNIETMMQELGLPDPDHHAANVNADAEVVAARRLVAQAKELLKLADERFHRVHDISIAMGAEKGRKIRAFRMLLKKIREAMREEGWTDLGEASEEEADSSDSS